MLTHADLVALRKLALSYFERALIAGKHQRGEEAKYLREQFHLLNRVVEFVDRHQPATEDPRAA